MDELDKSFLAGEGMVNIEEAKKGHHNENCLNCGTKLEDIYCHHCGQKDLPRRQSLGELGMNFVSSFINYEGKFLLTIRNLITRPGLMAKEYNEGRRERYFHPVRMYAFISFIFFLIFFSIPEKDNPVEMTEEDKRELAKDSIEAKGNRANVWVDTTWVKGLDSTLRHVDSIARTKPKRKNRFNFDLSKADYTSMSSYDSAQALLPEEGRDGWFMRKMNERSIVLNEKYGKDTAKFKTDFWQTSLSNFPKALFFLLPVFALLLKLLYIRRNFFYSEHLVFSIYYYNFFYFAGSVMMLIGVIPGMNWLYQLIGYGIWAYLVVSMKRMYGQDWGKTTAKFFIFSFLFGICCLFGFLINLFVTILML